MQLLGYNRTPSFLVSVYKEMQQLVWLAPCWHATACAFVVCDSTQDTDDGSPLALVYYTPHPCYCYCWRKCVKSAALSTPTRLMPSSKLRRLMQPRKRWLHHADQLEHERLTPRSYTDEGTPVCTLHGYTSVVLAKHTHSLLDADLCRSLCVIYVLTDIYTSRVCVLSSLRSQEKIN